MTFKPLDIVDYEDLKRFFSEQPYSLSIYAPASIVAWSNLMFKTGYTLREGTCFIANELQEDLNARHLILPVSGPRQFKPFELHDYAKALGYERYWFVPDDYLDLYSRSEWAALFFLEEQTEFDEYLYRTEDLIQLKGNKFSKKRNLINQFKRTYLFYDRVSVESIRRSDVEECVHFLEMWCEEHACSAEEQTGLACEKAALIKTLQNFDLFESMGILIRVDGVVSALGIGSRLNQTTATLNFEKAFGDIKGLYQFLDNECAKRLFNGYLFINKESDMNLQKLAESKQSYYPIRRIRCFKLILR
jgi:hypothetical protein